MRETNRVSNEHSDAAILQLPFTVHITLFAILNLLYFYISTFQSTCIIIVITIG